MDDTTTDNFTDEPKPTTLADFKGTREYDILCYFEWEHQPPHLQAVSIACQQMAFYMMAVAAPGAERTAGLRKLLEAKDCFVRAALDNPRTTETPCNT